MHGGGGAPSCCAFTHRVAFEEGSGPRVLLKSPEGAPGQGEQHCKEGRGQESLWGTGPGQRVGGSRELADITTCQPPSHPSAVHQEESSIPGLISVSGGQELLLIVLAPL